MQTADMGRVFNAAAAYPNGRATFPAAVREHDKTDRESLESQQHDFEAATKLELGQ
ncbi:hypothetical protein [Novipirellula artificiosorum]|uniref:hypothetical protein n=1 Tax=Novipirellula artificiosorum TaxID=2528016 RepID=UPI0018CEF3C0|nr:hypothetical protein [Novipirellula artificiosorum]